MKDIFASPDPEGAFEDALRFAHREAGKAYNELEIYSRRFVQAGELLPENIQTARIALTNCFQVTLFLLNLPTMPD